MLRDLMRINTPSVEPIGVVTGREDLNGRPLDPILVTRHLQFSLPYRSLFLPGVRKDTVMRLIDALVVLLARLHLQGFLWGDVSLSNVLFRRDAGAFAAYLVAAETGELHDKLSDGQRAFDIELMTTNLFGEFCDLETGGMLDEALDPLHLVETIQNRYQELWHELTGIEEFPGGELDRIENRVRRLNALGFDVGELDIQTSPDGSTIQIQPKVVDAGHHARRLMKLTGLDAQENQARRLLNDLDTYRVRHGLQHADEAVVAHQWLTEHFEPVVNTIPSHLTGKRDPAQVFHEVLDYRWYQSQREFREVPLVEATQGYIRDVLSNLPEERISADAMDQIVSSNKELANKFDPTQGFQDEDPVDDEPEPFDPWEQDISDEEIARAQRFDLAALRAKHAQR